VTSPVTTTRGEYQTTLSAGTRSGTARITAHSGTASGQFDVDVKPDAPATLAVSASPAPIIADGVMTSTVIARASDQYGNPIRDNTLVVFSVSRGRIDPPLSLTRGGVAQAVYTAGTQAGHVSIFASAGMIDGSGGIDLLPGPPSVISLTADPAMLTVGPNQAILRGQVVDRYSNTVADGTSIVLTTTLGQVGSPVTTAEGRFQAVLTAGTRAGTAQVSARSGAVNTRLDVPIHSGPTRLAVATVLASRPVTLP